MFVGRIAAQMAHLRGTLRFVLKIHSSWPKGVAPCAGDHRSKDVMPQSCQSTPHHFFDFGIAAVSHQVLELEWILFEVKELLVVMLWPFHKLPLSFYKRN
jgi:hypothetical protein